MIFSEDRQALCGTRARAWSGKACPALVAGWKPVFPRDKRGTRLRGDHAQTKS